MKKLVLTSAIALACVGAFAQGKVRFVNDSVHLLYFTTDAQKLDSADAGLAGQALPSNGNGSLGAHSIIVDLFAGTSSSSLSRVSTTSFSSGGTAGTFVGANVSMTPGGTGFNGTAAVPSGTDFFQVLAYDSAAGSYAAALAGNGFYYGSSPIFTTVAGSGTPYNSIASPSTPAFSTWAAGTSDQSAATGLAGARGAIQIQLNLVPEPSTIALAGLSAAALAIFRRRKQ